VPDDGDARALPLDGSLRNIAITLIVIEATQIAFGDKVRIRSTQATESRHIAGLTGIVYGHIAPSVTGVKVIGESSKDLAISARLDEKASQLWFAEELLEFVDHAAGTTVEVSGRKLIRDARGEWREAKPN